MSKSQKAIAGCFVEIFGIILQPVKIGRCLLTSFSHLVASSQPGSPCFKVLALRQEHNSSWGEGDRIIIAEVACSKTVLWVKFPLTAFQQYSLAILKDTKFSVHKGTCDLCSFQLDFIC